MEKIQAKINAALSAIQFLSNTLELAITELTLLETNVKIEDYTIPQKDLALKIISLANEIGDYADGMELLEDSELEMINGIYGFINETFEEDIKE